MTAESARKRPGRLLVWRRHWRHAWKEAWALLWEKPGESLLTLLVMALAALPAAGLWLATQQVQQVEVRSQGDWVVFLQPEAGQAQASELAEVLRTMPEVRSVVVRNPESILQQYLQGSGVNVGDAGLARGLFPWVLEVQARDGLAPAVSDRLARDWQQRWPEQIDEVAHDPAWQALRLHLGRFLGRALFWIAVFSALALFFVVSNTVHLRLRRHQEAMEVMSLLGASDAYLRRPYLLASLLGGLLAGVVLLALLGLVLYSLSGPWQVLRQDLGLPQARLYLPWQMLLLWPVLLAILSVLAARISLARLRRG